MSEKMRTQDHKVPSSHEQRATALAKVREIRAAFDELGREYDAIIAAHPKLQALADQRRELRAIMAKVGWDARYYRFSAYKDGALFRTIIAEGDTLAECKKKAAAR